MIKEIFDGKNQKRRKNSMLKSVFGKLKYLFVLALILLAPIKAWAGAGAAFEDANSTDETDSQLFSFWDLRDRDSFVQVTNTSGSPIFVHVQIFNVPDGCDELDFYDRYTAGDTHVYNLRDLVANAAQFNPLNISLPGAGYGLVAVTVVTGDGGLSNGNPVLIGNFRVIDSSGYEYRSNSAGIDFGIDGDGVYTFNFSNASASDVIGVLVDQVGPGFLKVLAANGNITFDVNQFNVAERRISCSSFTFACNPVLGFFDVGINDVVPAAKGGPVMCNGSSEPDGFVRLVILSEGLPGSASDIFVGFIGLNGGDGTGSMDSWWQNQDSLDPIPATTNSFAE